MKHFVAALVFVLTTAGQANVIEGVFLPQSLVPKELQPRILEAIGTRCSPTVSQGLIFEESTLVHEKYVDQDTFDSYFTTKLNVYFNFDSGQVRKTIVVESVEYDLSNPAIDQFEILKLTAEDSLCR